MREGFLDFTSNIPIPTLYGLSALGTRFCVYKYTVADRSVIPPRIPPGVAPKERWDFDLLEAEGEARLKGIVTHIKAMVAALQ
ncbi:uncharacterized protein EI90DRAFT_3036117 [Cantharellus anzutake]|uniref:uncharacterized protein n=1 Tax=Cantharellus anzutake TaxID=1750568 RepID=UPI00190583E1|nr:uncharacterized protein EI90DRAFT_3036117 [Cantharellus anzutake]KAF8340596.1 hypothetical protein EI90DRAFT_3036117 [Cantharellus anzutake]